MSKNTQNMLMYFPPKLLRIGVVFHLVGMVGVVLVMRAARECYPHHEYLLLPSMFYSNDTSYIDRNMALYAICSRMPTLSL